MNVRRARHLVCYWQTGRLFFHNYARGTRISADPRAATILSLFDDWKPASVLRDAMPGYNVESLDRSIAALVSAGLLEVEDRERAPEEIAMDSWQDWNPAAGFFHSATKNTVANSDYVTAEQVLRDKLTAGDVRKPPPVKRCAGPRTKLASVSHDGELARVLLSRRTSRTFSRTPVTAAQLSTLLGLTWGVHGWVDTPYGLSPQKTNPSGGGCHAIEAYVVAIDVDELAPGIYHYAADTHELVLLREGATSTDLAAFIPGQRWFHACSAAVLSTAMLQRMQWRYHYARAYRAVLAEAGHLAQTCVLVATELGLGSFCTMAIDDAVVEGALGIDGITETVLYVAGVGSPA